MRRTLTIYVPDDLRERLASVREYVNVSDAACTGIQHAIIEAEWAKVAERPPRPKRRKRSS